MENRSREAISSIKGYYYQFDYYVLQLLSLENDDDSVRIEGIEDVDILLVDTTKAVQCKYYAETKCTPSVIGKAIRPMLAHFSENKVNPHLITYRLFGCYSNGTESIELPLTVEYSKNKLFTFTEKGVKHELHKELGLTDADIRLFLSRLELQINAVSYEDQIEKIIICFQKTIHCTEYDARYFYYVNAVSFVKEVVVKKTMTARTVTKKRFLDAVCKKRVLFDKWFLESVGFEKYYKASRKEFFTQMNVSPMHRVFLYECDNVISNTEIASILIKTSEKWSKLSPREKNAFCPYVYIHGISPSRLAEIKGILYENDFHVWDGYEYKDAPFFPDSLARAVNHHTGIRAKIINKVDQINSVLERCSGQKAVYQFYLNKPFYCRESVMGNDFQIQATNDVLKII